jgi:hypothetical protein
MERKLGQFETKLKSSAIAEEDLTDQLSRLKKVYHVKECQLLALEKDYASQNTKLE